MAPPAGRSRKLVTFPPKGSQAPPRGPGRRLDALLAEVVLELDGPVESKAQPTVEAPSAAEDKCSEPQEFIPAPDWKQQERPRQHGLEESQAVQKADAITKEWAKLEEELAATAHADISEEQRQRLEESRQRAKARREQRQAAREAAQQHEEMMQRRLRTHQSVAEKEASGILVDDALSLQRELIVGLRDGSVQRRLQHLQRSLLPVDPKAFAKECQELILKVQSEVLPKYGIPGGYAGVQRMLREFDKPSIRLNQDFVQNSKELNRLFFGNSSDGTKDQIDAACLVDAECPDPVAKVQQPEGKEMFPKGFGALGSEFGQRLVVEELNLEKDELHQNGLGASKSLASRLFAEAVAPSEERPQAAPVKSSAEQELRLRQEAASFLSSARRRAGSCRSDSATGHRFDGEWEDGEGTVHIIKDNVLRGLCPGKADLVIAHDAQCLLRVGTSFFEGKFSTDGRLLWKDGSMWVRRHGSGEEGGGSSNIPQIVAAGEGGQGQAQGGGGAPEGPGQAAQSRGQGAHSPAAAGWGQATGPGPHDGAGGAPGGSGPGAGRNPGQPDGGGGDPGSDPNAWYEDAPSGRIFQQTLPLFHPPEKGDMNRNGTVWKESGLPMIRLQFSTDGTRVKRDSCYSKAAAEAHVAGNPWLLVEALREDITTAIGDRNATRFVDAMETLESIISDQKMLKKELNRTLGSLGDADKQAAKKFILQAMPYRSKELLEPNPADFEVQSVFQEPSWYSEWEVQPMWMWPLPILFASHQQSLLLDPTYTEIPHKWSLKQ